MGMNAGRIQNATNQLLQARNQRLQDLEPEQFRGVINDVAAELAGVPKSEVLNEIMDMWSRANERGAGKEKVTGGDQYQGATAFQSMKGSPLATRMDSMTEPPRPGKVDLESLVSPAEFAAAEKGFQTFHRQGFGDLGLDEMKQIAADLKLVAGKTGDAAQLNRFLEIPPGAELVDVYGVPDALKGDFKVSEDHLTSPTVAGRAKQLEDRFRQTGVPQATLTNGGLMIVDDKRPDADAAMHDYTVRQGQTDLNRDVRGALFEAESRLGTLEKEADTAQVNEGPARPTDQVVAELEKQGSSFLYESFFTLQHRDEIGAVVKKAHAESPETTATNVRDFLNDVVPGTRGFWQAALDDISG
jgi:hypothetical protein